MTVQPHPYLHSLHDVSFSYIFKSAIIGCKLATTEYGAETFFQSQLVIRWCYISRVSPKAYEMLKESGIQMPTRRTLNDAPGFHNAIDNMSVSEATIEN